MRLLILLCLLPKSVMGYQDFISAVPNGNKVPSSCGGSGLWPGFGHFQIEGGGARNQFGLDFAKYGNAWGADICRLDSDGDTLTNGEELGDPDCVWTSGTAPNRTTNISHPGVCEPIRTFNCSVRSVPSSGSGQPSYKHQRDWILDVCQATGTSPLPSSLTTIAAPNQSSPLPSSWTTPAAPNQSSPLPSSWTTLAAPNQSSPLPSSWTTLAAPNQSSPLPSSWTTLAAPNQSSPLPRSFIILALLMCLLL